MRSIAQCCPLQLAGIEAKMIMKKTIVALLVCTIVLTGALAQTKPAKG